MNPHYSSTRPFGDANQDIIVVIAYRNDLNIAWAMEYILACKKHNKYRRVLDLSHHNVCNETSPLVSLWNFLTKRKLVLPKYFSTWNASHQLPITISPRTTFTVLMKSFLESLKIMFRMTPDLNTEQTPEALVRSVHSSIANKLSTVNYIPFLHPLAIFYRVLAFSRAEHETQQILNQYESPLLIVPNGRFPVSAGAVYAAAQRKVMVKYLERGGSPGMLNVFDQSPHSMIERRESLERIWSSATSTFPDLAKAISRVYLDLRLAVDPHSGIQWNRRRNFSQSELIDKFSQGRSLIVFFTSTELEFAVFQEPSHPRYHPNQSTALQSLLEVIDSSRFAVVVRRHPQKKFSLFDRERQLWRTLRKENDLLWFGPRSTIDSYMLAKRAQFVFHFNSGIGAELIELGHEGVISLGPSPWLDPNSLASCGSSEQIEDRLRSNKKIDLREQVWKWGYFQVMAGTMFAEVEWRSGRMVLPADFQSLKDQ